MFDKNKCGHTNYEGIEIESRRITINEDSTKNSTIDCDKFKQKEQFKVDKLGWYESTDKYKFECVRIYNNKAYFLIENLSKEPIQLSKFNLDGTLTNDFNEVCVKLIKYLGSELPKELRKFEFEAEIISIINTEIYLSLKEPLYIKQNGAKFLITMEEIIE